MGPFSPPLFFVQRLLLLLPSTSSSAGLPSPSTTPGLLRAAAPYPTSRSAFALSRPHSSVLLRRPLRPVCCGAVPRLDGARKTATRPSHHVRGGLCSRFPPLPRARVEGPWQKVMVALLLKGGGGTLQSRSWRQHLWRKRPTRLKVQQVPVKWHTYLNTKCKKHGRSHEEGMFFCLSSHILGAKIHLTKVGGIPFRQQRRVKALLGGDRDISCHALPTSFAGAGDVVVGAQEDASVRRNRRCSCRGTGGRLSRRGQRDHHDSAYFFSLLQRSGRLDSTQLRASVSGEQKSARQHSTFSLLVKV